MSWPVCGSCNQLTDSIRGVCNECYDIEVAATNAISIARELSVPKYGPSSWRENTDHLMRAYCHIRALLIETGLDPENYPDFDYNDDEDHLSHAICRLAMAKALLNDNI